MLVTQKNLCLCPRLSPSLGVCLCPVPLPPPQVCIDKYCGRWGLEKVAEMGLRKASEAVAGNLIAAFVPQSGNFKGFSGETFPAECHHHLKQGRGPMFQAKSRGKVHALTVDG